MVTLLPAILVGFTACSSTPGSSKSNEPANPAAPADQGNFAGQVVTDSVTRTDTVVSLDVAQRKIELKHADGQITGYRCGPQVVNLDQIQGGDQVRTIVVDEMALFVKPAGATQNVTATTAAVGAWWGARPGVVSLETLDLTAKVLAIDPWQHQVTLQTADGRTRTVTVGEFVNLADFNVGDEVVVRLTQALAIRIEKP